MPLSNGSTTVRLLISTQIYCSNHSINRGQGQSLGPQRGLQITAGSCLTPWAAVDLNGELTGKMLEIHDIMAGS